MGIDGPEDDDWNDGDEPHLGAVHPGQAPESDDWDDEDENSDGAIPSSLAAPLPTSRSDEGNDQTVSIPMIPPGQARARDAALIAPLSSPPEVDEDEDWDDEPDAVLPQAAQQRPIRQNHRTARSNSIQPGHLICGDCGQGNTPTRRFCSRCGSELSEAEVARTPWWHKLRLRRGPRIVPLNTGTGRGGGPTTAPGARWQALFIRAKIMVGLLVGLCVLTYASYQPFRQAVDQRIASVQKSVVGFIQSQYSPVRPEKVTSAGSRRGHGPENTVDLNTVSYWARPFDPDKQSIKGNVELDVRFDGLVSLNQLIVTPGVADAFTDHGRPRDLVVEYSNGKRTSISLQDSAKAQKFPLPDATAITGLKITIATVFPSEKGKDVTISELEFFSLLS
ncbi:NADase-type glycan-binding domain-containing protein [Streptomyces cinereoruber]|uniref:NADase-type glycan-binding domain-containing protein n=1 Tax=Streptomyces cinereoruber TaxID=67260 RepID=UPI00364AD95F